MCAVCMVDFETPYTSNLNAATKLFEDILLSIVATISYCKITLINTWNTAHRLSTSIMVIKQAETCITNEINTDIGK